MASAADARSIADLHALNWQRHYRGVLPDRYLDHEVVDERRMLWFDRFAEKDSTLRVICLYDQEELIGFSGFFLDHHNVWGTYIDNLHVLREYQGLGLGRQLMQMTAQGVLAHGGLPSMYLHVFTANFSAIAFYERVHGLRVDQVEVDCPGGVRRPIFLYLWNELHAL